MKQALTEQRRVIFLMSAMGGGGAQRVVIELLQNLDRQQFRPYLALQKLQGPYMSLVPTDVPIIDMSRYQGKANLVRRIWGVKQVVDELKPHVIIAGLNSPNCSLLRAAPLIRQQCRLVVTEHNHLTSSLRSNHKGIMRLAKTLEIKLLYPWADRVIAVSQGVKEDLVQNFGLDESRVKLIYNPVNVHNIQSASRENVELPWHAADDRKTIVAAGRLVPQKGFDDLIRAFAKIRSQLPCRLLILGEGELRPQLMAMVNGLGLQDDVYLPGFVQNPWAYMKKADLYLSGSRWEGFHLTIVEAMASGVAVVATDCDFGPREIIQPGTNGLLVPVGNTDAIAANVIGLLSDDAKRMALARAGNDRAKDFDAKLITKLYESLFDELT